MALLLIVLVILLLVTLILALPVSADITVTIHERTDSRLRIFYFSPRFCLEFRNFSREKNKQEKAASTKSGPGLRRILDTVRPKDLWNKMWLLIKRLVSGIKIRNVETDLEISLGDDYYTGMMSGLLLPLILVLNQQFSFEIKVLPAFEEDLRVKGYLYGRLQVTPLSMISAVAAFIFSGPALRAAWALSKSK